MSTATFIQRAWPGIKLDLIALATVAFICAAAFGCQLAFGWNADNLILGWIAFIAAKSHVRLTSMGQP